MTIDRSDIELLLKILDSDEQNQETKPTVERELSDAEVQEIMDLID